MSALLLDPSLTSRSSVAHSSRRARIAGRVLSGLAVLFLLFDGVTKLMLTPQVSAGMAQVGFPIATARPIGIILLVAVALYLVPRTAVLGAILITGFLGGAIAAQLRVGNPLLGYTFFPLYVAAFVWGGLYLRDGRVRHLIGPAR